MSAAIRTHTLRTSLRAAPSARAACSRRAYSTDVPPPPPPPPKPSGGGNGVLLAILGATAVAGGYYYLSAGEPDLAAKRKADEERVRARATELRDAGKATAHDAVRQGEHMYDETKNAAQDKVQQARAQGAQTTQDARDFTVRQYDGAKAAVGDAANKVERTFEDAKSKTKEEAQGWNDWFWGMFGYGKDKAKGAKREGAEKLGDAAQKVEKEAYKRT